jgi:hypothetical protein
MNIPGVPGGVPMNMGNRFNDFPENPLFRTYQNPQVAPNSITPDNVLSYFCDHNNAAFYDRTSDNEQLRMQNVGLQGYGIMNEMLSRMTGIQYVLHSSSPPLYVICKQRRNSPVNGKTFR